MIVNICSLHHKGPVTEVWDDAIYLGPFTDSDGKNYDLGIVRHDWWERPLACIVYGNEPSNYKSGELIPAMDRFEIYAETRRRAMSLQLI